MADKSKDEKKKVTIKDIIDCVLYFLETRLFMGCLMIFLGIRIMIDPSSAPSKISFGLGLVLIIASIGLIVGFITSKSFNKSNISLLFVFVFWSLFYVEIYVEIIKNTIYGFISLIFGIFRRCV